MRQRCPLAVVADQRPIARTLTAGDRRDRLAWIARLNRDALHGYDRADLTRAARAGFWSVWRAHGGWDRRLATQAALIQGRRDRTAVRCKASRPDQDACCERHPPTAPRPAPARRRIRLWGGNPEPDQLFVGPCSLAAVHRVVVVEQRRGWMARRYDVRRLHGGRAATGCAHRSDAGPYDLSRQQRTECTVLLRHCF